MRPGVTGKAGFGLDPVVRRLQSATEAAQIAQLAELTQPVPNFGYPTAAGKIGITWANLACCASAIPPMPEAIKLVGRQRHII